MAAALERKVWLGTGYNRVLYPNIYTILVGPPGVGKTEALVRGREFLSMLTNEVPTESLQLSGGSITYASFLDELYAAERKVFLDNMEMMTFNSLAIFSTEIGVLFPEYSSSFMNKLTDLYDAHPFHESRRTKSISLEIERPCVNLFAATTPAFLGSFMPAGAWEEGFMSRTFIVFSAEVEVRELFGDYPSQAEEYRCLKEGLRDIFDLHGRFTLSKEAEHLVQEWHQRRGPPAPDHPRLINYLTRRTFHLLKLCMIASASRTDDLVIDVEDFQLALDWIVEMESFIPDLFKSFTSGGAGRVIDEAWHFCFVQFTKTKRPVPESLLINFLKERVSVHDIPRIVDIMERTKMLQESLEAGVGKVYTPRPRKTL